MEQTIIFRLRTGHCWLLSHYVPPRAISHKWVPMWNWRPKPKHILQNCLAHTLERIWLAIWGWLPGQAVGIQGGTSNHCLVRPVWGKRLRYMLVRRSKSCRSRRSKPVCYQRILTHTCYYPHTWLGDSFIFAPAHSFRLSKLSGWPTQILLAPLTTFCLSSFSLLIGAFISIFPTQRTATFTPFFCQMYQFVPRDLRRQNNSQPTEHTIAETNLAATTGYQLQTGIEKQKVKVDNTSFCRMSAENLGHDIKIELWLKT